MAQFAPAPKVEAIHAGLYGMVGAGLVVNVFCAAARLDIEEFSNAVALVSLAGYLGPRLYFRHPHDKHDLAAVRRERELREQDAGRT